MKPLRPNLQSSIINCCAWNGLIIFLIATKHKEDELSWRETYVALFRKLPEIKSCCLAQRLCFERWEEEEEEEEEEACPLVKWIIPHADPILEPGGTDRIYSSKTEPHLCTSGLLGSNVSTEIEGHGRPCHLAISFLWPYTTHPLTSRTPSIFHHCPPIFQNLLGEYKMLRLQLHPPRLETLHWTWVQTPYVPGYSLYLYGYSGPGSDWLRAGRSGIESRWGTRFSARPDRPWGPPSLL